MHRAGVHHRHRQPCGSVYRHPFRRGGGGVLDVGHGAAGHDDQLRRERAGYLLPPQRPGGRLARRADVLPAGRPWRQDGAGAGGAVCRVLCAGKLWHRQPEPAQFHRGQSERGLWRAGDRHRRSAGGSIGGNFAGRAEACGCGGRKACPRHGAVVHRGCAHRGGGAHHRRSGGACRHRKGRVRAARRRWGHGGLRPVPGGHLGL